MTTKYRWPVVAGAAALVLAFFGWLWIAPGGERGAAKVSGPAGLAAIVAAAAACLYAGRRLTGRNRLGWTLMGLGMVATAFGESVWVWHDLFLSTETPDVSIADVGYLAQVPLTLAGMAALVSGHGKGGLRSALDGVLIGVSFLYVSWVTVLSALYATNGQDVVERMVTLAYPVGDVATATMAFILVSNAGASARTPLLLAGGGLLALALADSAFVYLAEKGLYHSGSLLDVGWFAAFVLIGLAGLRAANPVPDDPPVDHRDRYAALPYVPAGVAFTTLVVLQFGRDGALMSLVAGIVLVAAVLVRQLVAVRDSLFLRARLDAAVQKLRRREDELREAADHDPLTGLPNRAMFLDHVEQALARQRGSGTTVTVLTVDLDDFTTVNERLGHHAGDAVLDATARRLQACVRPGDAVARLGGDTFAVVLERAAGRRSAVSLAQRIIEQLSVPVPVGGGPAQVGASVAVAVHAGGPKGVGELLREAEYAMYEAKAQGKGRVVTFEPTPSHSGPARLAPAD